MAQPIFIPGHVEAAIIRHIKQATSKVVAAYDSAKEEEDSLTGQLGFALKTSDQIEDGWTWSIDYTKFRGRGPHATEKTLGADGILEIRVHTREGERRKAALFQTKNDLERDPNLLKQALLLSNWREASFVVNFTSSDIETFSIDDVIRARGIRSQIKRTESFSKFISDKFFPCTIGNSELEYDRERRVLTWLSHNREQVGISFSVRSRIHVNIREWKQLPRIIDPINLSEYRMYADPYEILAVTPISSSIEIKKAKQKLAFAYHPDKFGDMDSLYREIANRRMQEINEAVGKIKKK